MKPEPTTRGEWIAIIIVAVVLIAFVAFSELRIAGWLL